MFIFIDESGGFQVPTRQHSVSCVSALLVPETLAPALFRAFSRTIEPWTKQGLELKGSQLVEEQMASVIATVRRYDVLLLSVAIDMGLHSDDAITRHKHGQAAKFVESASRGPQGSSMRTLLERWAAEIRSLSNQLYVQSILLCELVESVINIGSLYYVQRIPKTLGSFAWRIDAKDVTVTRYERLWRETVEPYLQTATLKQPQPHLDDADYSAFARYMSPADDAPQHLQPHLPDPRKQYMFVDTGKLLSDLEFRTSHEMIGLQIVDMLASAIRRACNGTLQPRGWAGLGRLMPRPQRGKQCVEFVALDGFEYAQPPYANVVRSWDPDTRRVVVV